MQRFRLYIASLLLLALTGCGQAAAAAPETTPTPVTVRLETTAPAVTPQILSAIQELSPGSEAPEEERIRALCVSIVDQLPCSVDLDGDGACETVDLVPYVPEDEYPRWAVVLRKDGQEQRRETEIPCDTWYDLWVGDLDEDGGYEIFFHGDTASDDYLIYGFRSDLTPLAFEADERFFRYGQTDQTQVLSARVLGFEDGYLVAGAPVDMLGTHYGVRSFGIGADGVICPVVSVWEFTEEEDRPLTVKRTLTAYKAGVRKDPGEAFALEAGEKIWPLASDGHERLWFRTEKGRGGVLLLVPDERDMWRIDGIAEADLFEELPYAG